MSALEKLLKGEVLTEEEKSSLTPEQIAEARRKELDALEGIRAERRRVEAQRAEAEANSGKDFAKRLVEENTVKAEQAAFDDLANRGIDLTEEKKAKIRDMRKKLDSGAVTFENLFQDFMAAAAAVDRDVLFKDRENRLAFEKSAAEFQKNAAGGSGSGSSPDKNNDKQYSQEVWDMVNEARRQGLILSPEEALVSLTQGLRRIHK